MAKVAPHRWAETNDRIGATARAAFRRACWRSGLDTDATDDPAALGVLATARPDVGADTFVRLCEASAKAWVDGNNSGNPDTLRSKEAESQRLGDAAEVLAGLYGCTCDWPGLYPVLHRGEKPNRTGEYGTTSQEAVRRFFAEPREAEIRALADEHEAARYEDEGEAAFGRED